MKTPACSRYREALDRQASGEVELDAGLDAHLASCASCTEEHEVASWLRQSAREVPVRPLASASQLWWKAEIIRRLTDRDTLVDRATRPLRWGQWASLVLVSLLAALFATWLGGALGESGADLARLATGWRGILGLLAFGSAPPLLGFGVMWLLWRDA